MKTISNSQEDKALFSQTSQPQKSVYTPPTCTPLKQCEPNGGVGPGGDSVFGS